MTKSSSYSVLLLINLLSISYRAHAFGIPAPERLRRLLDSEMNGTRESSIPIILPCCYDGLSARLIARAGFEATFMTGFGVSGEIRLKMILKYGNIVEKTLKISSVFS